MPFGYWIAGRKPPHLVERAALTQSMQPLMDCIKHSRLCVLRIDDTIFMHGERCVNSFMGHGSSFGGNTYAGIDELLSHSACQAGDAWVQLVKRQFVKCACSQAGARGAGAMPVWLLRAARPPAPASPRLMCTCRPSRGGPSAASAASAALSRRECDRAGSDLLECLAAGRGQMSGPTCPT